MTDDTARPPAPEAAPIPLDELWLVETAGHVRRALLFRHAAGFEVRIDEDGDVVDTRTFDARPDAEAFAHARRQRLNVGGMTDE